MRSCAIHVHKHSVEAMLLQQCREVTTVILSITPWLPTYMGQSLIRCNKRSFQPRTLPSPLQEKSGVYMDCLQTLSLTEALCSFPGSGRSWWSIGEWIWICLLLFTPKKMSKRNGLTKSLKATCATTPVSSRTIGQSCCRWQSIPIIPPPLRAQRSRLSSPTMVSIQRPSV